MLQRSCLCAGQMSCQPASDIGQLFDELRRRLDPYDSQARGSGCQRQSLIMGCHDQLVSANLSPERRCRQVDRIERSEAGG